MHNCIEISPGFSLSKIKKITLFSLSSSQRQFEENRNAEMVETQRLEEQERRRREEKVWSLVDICLLTLLLF